MHTRLAENVHTMQFAKELCFKSKDHLNVYGQCSYKPGKEANFVVWDLQATPLMKMRNPDPKSKNIVELTVKAFVMITLETERTVTATYVAGKAVYFSRISEKLKRPTYRKEF